jgi:hypothetical protein
MDLAAVKNISEITYFWHKQPGTFVDKRTGIKTNFSFGNAIFGSSTRDWESTLLSVVLDLKAEIDKRHRLESNVVVCGKTAKEILEKLPIGFKRDFDEKPQKCFKFGRLHDILLFSNPDLPEDEILVCKVLNPDSVSDYWEVIKVGAVKILE